LEKVSLRGPFPAEKAVIASLFHWYDSSKARHELGYSTRPAREAIAASVEWMSAQGLLGKQ
jgi:dihydroflavonol-4-reductase